MLTVLAAWGLSSRLLQSAPRGLSPAALQARWGAGAVSGEQSRSPREPCKALGTPQWAAPQLPELQRFHPRPLAWCTGELHTCHLMGTHRFARKPLFPLPLINLTRSGTSHGPILSLHSSEGSGSRHVTQIQTEWLVQSRLYNQSRVYQSQ